MDTKADPPHNIELEASVIATVLAGQTEGLVSTVRAHITHPLMFYGRNHQFIWLAVEALDEANQTVDMASVADTLKNIKFEQAIDRLATVRSLQKAHQLDGLSQRQRANFYRKQAKDQCSDWDTSTLATIGGYMSIVDITSAFVTSIGLEENAKRVVDYYNKREMIQALGHGAALSRSGETSSVIYQKITNALTEVEPKDSRGSVITAGKFTEENIFNEADPVDCGSWGITKLDRLIELDRSLLTILSGESGTGKTSLAMQVARHTAKAKGFAPGTIAIASVEVKNNRLMDILWAQAARCYVGDVRRRTWTPEQRNKAVLAAESWGDSITIADSDLSKWSEVATFARKHKRTYGDSFHTLIIDHMHLFESETPGGDSFSVIDSAMAGMVQLKKELNIHIFCLAQPNKASTQSEGKKPKQSDLKGSSSIQQGADSIVILTRGESVSHMHAVKNRWGGCETIDAVYDPSIGQAWCSIKEDVETKRDNKKYSSPPTDDENLFG